MSNDYLQQYRDYLDGRIARLLGEIADLDQRQAEVLREIEAAEREGPDTVEGLEKP